MNISALLRGKRDSKRLQKEITLYTMDFVLNVQVLYGLQALGFKPSELKPKLHLSLNVLI